MIWDQNRKIFIGVFIKVSCDPNMPHLLAVIASWIINEFENTRSKTDFTSYDLRLTLTKKIDNRKNSEFSFNIKRTWNCFFFILQTNFVQNLLNLTILYGKRLICNWEHSLRKQASTKNKPIYRRLLSMHLTFFLFFYFFEILH